MENVIANYKDLIKSYEVASEHYQKTNSTRLLKFALGELERFERSFVKHYSLEELMKLQVEFNAQGLLIV